MIEINTSKFDSLSVTSGHDHIGWIIRRSGKFIAFDAFGRPVGEFPTLAKAIGAIPSTSTSQQKEIKRD